MHNWEGPLICHISLDGGSAFTEVFTYSEVVIGAMIIGRCVGL